MAVFYLPVFAIIVCVLIITLYFRKWKLSGCIVILLLIYNIALQIFPVHFQSRKEKAPYNIRIVTYNIYPLDTTVNIDQWQRKVFSEIKALKPDILCIQELRHKKYSWLEEQLLKYYQYNEKLILERKYLRGQLYSRFPLKGMRRYPSIEQLDTIKFGAEYINTIKLKNKVQPYVSTIVHLSTGDSLVVFSCHLQSCGYSTIQRKIISSQSWLKGIPKYINAISKADSIRNWECNNLRHYIDSLYPKSAILIAGDFNDFSASRCLNIIQKDDFCNAWWNAGLGYGYTYQGFHLRLRIDHILYRRLHIEEVQVIESKLSDHRPLVADFKISK